MKKSALLLIDIQNIYFTKGKYLLAHPEETARNGKKVLDQFRSLSLPVIHVKHAFNTDGYEEDIAYLCDIYPLLQPLKGEKIINKTLPSSYLHTDLQEYLVQQKIEKLYIAGMMSHMCVSTTVRASQDYGYEVVVIEDACTTKALQIQNETIPAEVIHKSTMAALNGMFAKVINIANIKEELCTE